MSSTFTIASASNDAGCVLHCIDGNLVPSESGEEFEVTNPATGTCASKVARGNREDVRKAVAAAKAALKGEWSKKSPDARADILDAIAATIEANSEALAQLESEDSGKAISTARTIDIPRAARNFRFFAAQLRADETGCYTMANAVNYTLRQPVGVAGLITPWNLPLYLLTWKVAPALAMGNTVVAKPSELTPRTAAVLSAIIAATPGVPPGVFNVVHGFGADVGDEIVRHPDVALVSFTGGTATGKHVAAAAAPLFKKLSLELGGKNPTIVFADADFDVAVAGATRSAFTNAGQVCLAGSRILVERSLYPRFCEALAASVSALRVGDPADAATQVGPVSSAAHQAKVISYVDVARADGAKILCGGQPVAGLPERVAGGAFVAPTLVCDVPPTSRCLREEVFGPFATVQPFDTEAEAVAEANAVQYGLAASIWTRDVGKAHRVARDVEAGIVWVNCWLHRDLRTAFGGIKHSGVGREGGKYSFEFYSEYKNVCVHTEAM